MTIDWQYWLIVVVLLAFFYGMAGRILQSITPGGKLSRSGRRWRWTFTVAVALVAVGVPVSSWHRYLVRAALYGALGLLGIIFIRWWWGDWEREKAAREALVEGLHREGRELVPPQMSRGQKVWNWVLLGYGATGLLGGLYEIILHLVLKR